MSKVTWKPGTMVYPVPAVMVSCGSEPDEHNIITIAWTGTICTDPPMTYISVRKERHSYDIIKKTGEFVINLGTEDLAFATDFCGVKSGRDVNKFETMNLTPSEGSKVKAPLIEESPVNIECKVTQIVELGSHDMFMAEVVAVNVDEQYIDEKGKFHLDQAKPICYSHGTYFGLNEALGTFGYSVMKKKTQKKKRLSGKAAPKAGKRSGDKKDALSTKSEKSTKSGKGKPYSKSGKPVGKKRRSRKGNKA